MRMLKFQKSPLVWQLSRGKIVKGKNKPVNIPNNFNAGESRIVELLMQSYILYSQTLSREWQLERKGKSRIKIVLDNSCIVEL